MFNKFFILIALLLTVTNAHAYFGELNVPSHSYFGNNTGAAATVAPITKTQLTADLDAFTSLLQGVCPASGGGAVNFLRADGTWATPPGSSYTFADSIVNTAGTITLVGDTATPGASQYYGTNGASTLGYYNLPAAGSGTVTTVSVVSANGMAGTVANPTTTPALTLSTSVSGVVKANGTAFSAATAGTDYSAGTSGNATGIVKSTTGTGALTTAIAADFPTLNQNTTGNAATVTTNANLTGPVTSVGNATSVTNNAITNAMLAQMATHTFKGNNTGGTANALDLTATQLTAELNPFVGDSGAGGTQGVVPAPAAGDAAAGKFLKADGTFAVPPNSGGTVTAVSVASANGFAGSSSGGATPALTLSTSISGVLKGNGTAISAATSGTDYSAGTSGLATGLLKSTTGTGVLSIGAAGTDYQAPISTSGAVSNQFLTAFTAPNTFSRAQPAFTDISGSATAAQMLALPSADIYVGTAGNVPAAVAPSGGFTINNAGVATLGNTAVTGQVLTGFSAGAGVVAATDTILQAFNKLAGSIAGPFTVAQTTNACAAVAALNLDFSASNCFTKTIAAPSTFTFSNSASGQVDVLRLTNNGSAITYPSVTWMSNGGNPPANITGDQVITFFNDGTTIYGSDGTPSNAAVTSISVASANGFTGSSSGGATPALTLATSVTGVLKGNGTAISAAASGTDYQAPISTSGAVSNQFVTGFTAPNTFTRAQPAFTDISGVATVAQTTNGPTTLTEAAGATTIDWATSNTFLLTLNANLTSVTFSNATSGQTIIVAITNTASNYTVTWGNSILWAGGSQPVQTVGVHTDVWTLVKIGSAIYGSVVQNF